MGARRLVVLLVAVLAYYFVVLGDRGLILLRSGRPAFVGLGIGVLLLPVVGLWLVTQELRFGWATARLGRELGPDSSGLAEPLPRRPSGRVDLAAADAAFESRRTQVEAAPGDWRGWYRLAVAYGDAHDTARGRRAMRRAVELHRAEALRSWRP